MEHSNESPPQQTAPTPAPSSASVPPRPAAPSSAAATARPPGGFRWGVWLAVGVVVAVGVAMVLPREHKDKPPRPGTVADIALTLITSDRGDVACLSPKKFERYSCAFSDDSTAPTSPEADTLRPYMTLDRHVYLIPGLFLDPNIQRRYQAEPPTGPRDKLRRFTAKCKVKTAGRLEGFKLRWDPSGRWSEPQDADIATVVGCEVQG